MNIDHAYRWWLGCVAVMSLVGCSAAITGDPTPAGTVTPLTSTTLPDTSLPPDTSLLPDTSLPPVTPDPLPPPDVTSDRNPTPPGPTRPSPRPAPPDRTVTGFARDVHGTGSETVKIGFKNLSCDACSLVTATTDSGGAYHVSLPPADYLVACLATPFTCSIGDKGLDNEQISISSDLTVDILVTGGTVPPTSASPSPAPRFPVTRSAVMC